MEKTFQNLKKWQQWIYMFIKGFLSLLFRPLFDIFELSKKELYENALNKKWADMWMAIIPIMLIILFVVYGFRWLINDGYKILFSSRYEEVIIQDYENEVQSFFRKYEERFLAHDCWFMAEVWADELMFDKWWNETYPVEKYDCSAFWKVQRIKMLPIKINPIEKAGNKLKVQGEIIRIEITNGKPYIIAPMRFELWKTIDMELWHFNLYGEPKNRWIDSEFKLDTE